MEDYCDVGSSSYNGCCVNVEHYDEHESRVKAKASEVVKGKAV